MQKITANFVQMIMCDLKILLQHTKMKAIDPVL